MALRPAPADQWLLSPPGLERDEAHTYWLGDFPFPVSVTGVLSACKSPAALDAIASTRHQWEARGTTVHQALQLAASNPEWDLNDHPSCWPFLEWIEPLLGHPIWQSVEVIASELPLHQVDHHGGLSVAGTCDLAWQIPGTTSELHGGPKRSLVELKTQAHADSTPYDTRPQLGGYLALAAHHGLVFDSAVTLWARPGHTRLITHDVPDCLAAWQQALDRFLASGGAADAFSVASSSPLPPAPE